MSANDTDVEYDAQKAAELKKARSFRRFQYRGIDVRLSG